MWAFRRAVEEFHTDMLETDVQITRDGEVVVSHDPTLDRCTDRCGAISDMDFAELRSVDAAYWFSTDGGLTFPLRGKGIGIPTFREVLRAFPGVRINVELKEAPPGREEALLEVLWSEKAVNRVCLGSQSDALAESMQQAMPEGCFFYPQNAGLKFVVAVKVGLTPPEDPRWQVLDFPLRYCGLKIVTKGFAETAQRAGKWVNVWTVDDPEDMRECIQNGIGGVMTDRPDLLREILGPSR
jgi:glycerophosphoryl diester phosphodiesterase